MSIRGLWEIQTEAIIGIRFGDSDAETWNKKGMDKCLPKWGKSKKEIHGQYCHDQQKNFSLFSLSVYGTMGEESQVVLATFSQLMAVKMEEPIL